jgi:RNA-directed DNA polymerase
MSDKRQKNQLVLAFTEEGRSEAPKTFQEGTESLTAKCETERPARHEQLMEEVCERRNCWQAYKRVKANKGSPGIDGMKVGDLSGYLKQHWPSIREQLLNGTYQPQPVRRVEIPKPERASESGGGRNTARWTEHAPYTKGNFEFERVVRGWRASRPVLDLRLKR